MPEAPWGLLGVLVKIQILIHYVWGLRFYISNKLPGDANITGPQPTLKKKKKKFYFDLISD